MNVATLTFKSSLWARSCMELARSVWNGAIFCPDSVPNRSIAAWFSKVITMRGFVCLLVPLSVCLFVHNAGVKIAKSYEKCFLHIYAHTLHVQPFIILSVHHSVHLSIYLSIHMSVKITKSIAKSIKINLKSMVQFHWNNSSMKWKKNWKKNCIEKLYCCL